MKKLNCLELSAGVVIEIIQICLGHYELDPHQVLCVIWGRYLLMTRNKGPVRWGSHCLGSNRSCISSVIRCVRTWADVCVASIVCRPTLLHVGRNMTQAHDIQCMLVVRSEVEIRKG